ncbi:hypothetical protein ACR780_22175 [Sphingobacterium faecium]
MKSLTIEQLKAIDGGCQSCKNAGKKVGKFLRSALWIDEISEWLSE